MRVSFVIGFILALSVPPHAAATVMFPKDFIGFAENSSSKSNDAGWRRLGRQLIPRPSIEETRVPPPLNIEQNVLRIAIQKDIEENSSSSLLFLTEELLRLDLLNRDDCEPGLPQELLPHREWIKRLNYYSWISLKGDGSFRVHTEYMAFRSIVMLFNGLSTSDETTKRRLIETALQSTVAYRDEASHFSLFLRPFDLRYFSELDYIRHNTEVTSAPSAVHFATKLKNREAARTRVLELQKREFAIFSAVRKTLMPTTCSGVF